MQPTNPAPELKSAAGPEVSAAFEEFMSAFEAFKDANDQRLGALERRGGDVVTTDKVERLNAALDTQKALIDELVLKARRPALGGGGGDLAADLAAREHKAAFHAYVRTGEAAGLKRLEAKALSAGVGADGGYVVPHETEREIGKRLAALSPIRAIADVRVISAGTYKKPFMTSGPAVGWVAETGARAQTASPVLDEIAFPAMELYAMPAATQTLLDDAAVNIDDWLAIEVEAAFAAQEGTAFVTGDGVGKPKGFLAYDTVAESAFVWGKLGFIATGAAGDFPSTSPADPLVDLVYAVKAGYRQNGSFMMSRRTQGAVRKLKDENGQYLWAPPTAPGAPPHLMGFPVYEAEDMPEIGAGSLSVAFGDFRRGYLVVDRAGVRVLRDPYSAKPYVLFYTTKRVGGGVQDFDAIKLLKFAA
ncbi:phage major capsid protein [Ancylobacter dichloromethanicus]|uniref:Phage capsid protein n=1 Tax=Ancylobacter dichloromethanicus TaxID=518825 RepID=A0A9W6MXC7_9HYPH|nr:phage major capsid protein [Ancylobacter dichloromethanicus]MBS7556142.1 phage major capsid protein [Ancylobacter dichloromethanicus]GLK69896.1 phage capsid protein [Ancylobacter dichloromethanicus]